MSKKYGLLGEHLGHSYSKTIHERLADYTYDLIELSKTELDTFLTEKNFSACNVTIPYKRTVIPYLDVLDEQARRVGAVNTIVNREGILTGYNTDYDGFLYTLQNCFENLCLDKVIVLGNGGAAQAVFAVLKDLNAREIVVVKHHPEEGVCSYEEASRLHNDATFLVNTSPVGMYPNTEASPIDLTPYQNLTGVVDLIYNPDKTKLLLQAESMGIPAQNGLLMLVAQAFFAVEHFLQTTLAKEKLEEVYASFTSPSSDKS